MGFGVVAAGSFWAIGLDLHRRCTGIRVSFAFYTCTGVAGMACIVSNTSIIRPISHQYDPCYALPSPITAATAEAVEMVWRERQIFTLGIICCCNCLPLEENLQTHCGSWVHFDSSAWGVVVWEPL